MAEFNKLDVFETEDPEGVVVLLDEPEDEEEYTALEVTEIEQEYDGEIPSLHGFTPKYDDGDIVRRSRVLAFSPSEDEVEEWNKVEDSVGRVFETENGVAVALKEVEGSTLVIALSEDMNHSFFASDGVLEDWDEVEEENVKDVVEEYL